MLISKVRTYLSNQITAFDSDFKQHDDAFNEENIAKTNFNKAFHIIYEIPSVSTDQAYFTSTISAEVKFFFKGYRDTIETYDNAMDTVSLIVSNMASLSSLAAFRSTDGLPIQSCAPVSQVAEPLSSNDNSLIITLSLELEIIQPSC